MLRIVLFLTFLGTSVASLTVNLEDHCNQIFSQEFEDTITIRLTGDSYRNQPECRTQLILRPKNDTQLLVSFSEFQLSSAEDPEVCWKHFLKIAGLEGDNQEYRLCNRPPIESLSRFLLNSDNRVQKHLYYSRTVPLGSNDSIVLHVSTVAFAGVNGSCPRLAGRNNAVDDFRCDSDRLCIPEFLRCDGSRNCMDGSDERDCIGTTTPEPTTTSTSTVASLRPNKEIARGGDRRSGGSKTPHIIVGTVGGLVIIALVAVMALYLVRRKRGTYRAVTTTTAPPPAPASGTETTGEEINTSLRQPEDSTV